MYQRILKYHGGNWTRFTGREMYHAPIDCLGWNPKEKSLWILFINIMWCAYLRGWDGTWRRKFANLFYLLIQNQHLYKVGGFSPKFFFSFYSLALSSSSFKLQLKKCLRLDSKYAIGYVTECYISKSALSCTSCRRRAEVAERSAGNSQFKLSFPMIKCTANDRASR